MIHQEFGFRGPWPVHPFDDIDTDRPLTHDLFGQVTRKWRVAYLDPPWRFENRSELGEDRNPNQHYPTMSLEEIAALPLLDILDDDAVVFMWVVDPMLPHALKLLESWGLTFSTVAAYWAKTWEAADLESMHETKSFPIGTGYITRANPEQLWVAKRGQPRLRLHNIDGEIKADMSIRRLQFAPRGEHSEKPEKFAQIIERLYEGPYLEMFARKRRPGWGAWGNQVGLLDEANEGGRKKAAKVRPVVPLPLLDALSA